jgi:hypothetical protein
MSPFQQGSFSKKWLLDRFVGARLPKPVFAEDVDVNRAMRLAEVKWLLAEIAAPQRDSAWRA